MGSRKEQSALKGADLKKRDFWYLYVGNMMEDVSEEKIVEHLLPQTLEGSRTVLNFNTMSTHVF